MDTSVFRRIPKMDRLLTLPKVIKAGEGLPRALIRRALQDALTELREALAGGASLPDEAALETRLADAVRAAGQWRLKRVINTTGIVLHTNLGRAPLGAAVAEHIAEIAGGYSTLEYDLKSGSRGSRHALVEAQLTRLTGAEAAMVVNNNAAAVFLMLNTLAQGAEVVVSRGELVEIGGAFRVPEIMAASGAHLKEIGTTNKTHPGDYEAALECEGVAAILKVHTSNFRIVGFTEEVGIEELSGIAHGRGLPLLYDLGSGFLVRPEALGLTEGIYVPDAVRHADVCCFSGDKLFGAGQAGILLGRRELIERMKRNQLSRMLRVDKLTLSSLEAVLRLYEDPEASREGLPALAMLSLSSDDLYKSASQLCEALRGAREDLRFEVVPCTDEPGGGSLPGVELPGYAVAVSGCDIVRLEAALRKQPLPVIARIFRERLLLSLRTLLPSDAEALVECFASIDVNSEVKP